MKISLIILLFSVWASSSFAFRSYIYQAEYRSHGSSYLSRLAGTANEDLASLPSDQRKACDERYDPLLADSQLDIRVALGYLDWTTGNRVNYGNNSYGYSPSTDLGAYAALRYLLLSRCYDNLQLCGFSEDPNNAYVFRKNVRIRGKTIGVRVEAHFSSATEMLATNIGNGRQEQRERTTFMENFFTRGLQNADALLYFGHARSGGGPDFAPPLFVSGTNQVDYRNYYLVHKPGVKRMINALSGERKAPIIGILACNSRDLFLSRIRKVAPDAGVITTLDVSTVQEPFTAILGAIDALMRGKCQKSFYQSIRANPRNQQYITMDGMFE